MYKHDETQSVYVKQENLNSIRTHINTSTRKTKNRQDKTEHNTKLEQNHTTKDKYIRLKKHRDKLTHT